jgi:radical SAM family uncharacterized protein/radical SAM-linked protein
MKPARYVGGEYNQVVKAPGTTRVRMALAFPDVYDIGMSHLGTKILYTLLNRHADIAAERVFCPWVDMEKELRERGLPLLTLETASPLRDFDVVGFSLQYELTFTNVLTMLDLSGIPFRAADRDASHPLIIAGGPVATQPEPMAPFIDAFLIGDAEEKLPLMLLRVAELKAAGASRRDTLVEIAAMGGFYCPALYETAIDERTGYLVVGAPVDPRVPARTERQIVEDLNRFPFPDDAPVAAAEAIFDRMAIEIARGCTEGCRFCQAGMIYRPVRERDPQAIVDTIVSAVEKGGYDEVGLTTLSTADYSCISPLIKRVMERLRPEKVSLSVASLRAYGLDEDLLDEINTVRATGLTFAPEAGTQRMRDVINKNISEEDLARTAHRVFSRGWRRMKLYFMIGLPTETDEDVAGIMETGRRMRQIGMEYHKAGAVGVTVAVSSHVPKPHTPFQWCAMDTLEEIERKQDGLRDMARRWRLEFRRHDPRTTFLECVLGRGDRRMADVLEDVWRAGARFDSWDDHLRWAMWTDALRRHPEIPVQLFLGTLPVDGRTPWDHLDMKLEPKFLETEYKRAMKFKLSPPCGKPVGAQVHHTNLAEHEADARKLVCYHCGVACDLTQMREERGRFLERLGALDAPLRPAETTIETAELPAPPRPRFDPQKNGARPRAFAQGDAVRYRLQFTVSGVTALTGHLDFIRALPRVLRRAGLNAYYSEGFHPKPVMEFPPPLPLGVVSAGELVDIALVDYLEPGDLLARLNAAVPDGLVFTEVTRLEHGARKLTRVINAAEYVVRVDPELAGRAAPDLDAAPQRFMARDEVLWETTRKGEPRRVNIRPAVTDVRWIEEPDGLAPLGFLRPGARYLMIRTLLNAPAHARPDEVAAAVLRGDATESSGPETTPVFEPNHIARVELLGP